MTAAPSSVPSLHTDPVPVDDGVAGIVAWLSEFRT
jgi:hypothetical protein